MRQMAERFLTDGMVPETGDVERLSQLLGRPLRSYRDFAAEAAAVALKDTRELLDEGKV
jgi:hypothetical protein